MTIKPTKGCNSEVLAQIAEVVPVPVIISNFGGEGIFDHKIAYANSAFTKLTGFKNEHVIGRTPEFICDRNSTKGEDALMQFYNKCGYSDEFEFEIDSITRSGAKLKLQAKVAAANSGSDTKSFIISFTDVTAKAATLSPEEVEDFGIPIAPVVNATLQTKAQTPVVEEDYGIPVAPVVHSRLASEVRPFEKTSTSDDLRQRQKELEIAQEQQAAFTTAKQVAELQELMRQKEELQQKLNAKRSIEENIAKLQNPALQNNEAANDFTAEAGFVETDYDSIINEIVAELNNNEDYKEAVVSEENYADNDQLTTRHSVLENMISSIKRKTNEEINKDARISELKNTVQDPQIEDEIDYYAKTRFLSNMSHDLRTPLNAIIGFSEVIRDQLFGPIDNQRYVSYANDIFKSGQELLATISEVLELSEIETEDTLQLEEEEFDICETIDSVLDLLSAKAFQTDVRMMKRLQVSNILMNGDRRKLKQAVGGIVGNAIKCSPSGGKIEIVSEIDENGDFKFITYLKSANLIATRANLGSLLGTVTNKIESEYPEISLAKRFTEAHDGKFSIFNSATSGTEITLTIPKDRLIDGRKAKLQVINNN